MAWIFAIVVLLLLVYAPGFRKFALWMVGIGTVIVVINLANEKEKKETEDKANRAQQAEQEKRAQAEAKVAAARIPTSEILVSRLRLERENFANIAGRVLNVSKKFPLVEFSMHIAASDCPTSEIDKCVTIEEDDVTVKMTVPPGQARDFSETAYRLGNLHPQGRLNLSFRVTRTMGGEDAVAVK